VVGTHSNYSAAVEPVAFGRAGDDGGGGGEDDMDAARTTECPSMLGDESRASREPGWSDTWPKCLGGARQRQLRLRRDADLLAIGTGEPPGDDGGDVDDESGDLEEQRPSGQRRSVLGSACNRHRGNQPKTAMVESRELCCRNCHRRRPMKLRSVLHHCCCC
jgi:hypothetical protein